MMTPAQRLAQRIAAAREALDQAERERNAHDLAKCDESLNFAANMVTDARRALGEIGVKKK